MDERMEDRKRKRDKRLSDRGKEKDKDLKRVLEKCRINQGDNQSNENKPRKMQKQWEINKRRISSEIKRKKKDTFITNPTQVSCQKKLD